MRTDCARRYTRAINGRKHWCGHLWQERFHAFPMDETHLLATVRYVERNPVAARLCARDDGLVEVGAMLSRVDNWEAYLSESGDGATAEQISTHSRAGRPLGDAMFVHTLERITGRVLTCQPPGRKRKVEEK